jgi:hypothetical protein
VVEPQVDVQRRWVSLGLRPWCRLLGLARSACPAALLGATALNDTAGSTATVPTPSAASACRWRPLDLTRDSGGEAAAQVTGELGRRISVHVVELAERGARAASVGLVLSQLAKEGKTCPLQGLGELGRHRAPAGLVFWWGSRSRSGAVAGHPGALLACDQSARCRTGIAGLCAGRPVLSQFHQAVRRPVRHRGRCRQLCTGWTQNSSLKRLVLPSSRPPRCTACLPPACPVQGRHRRAVRRTTGASPVSSGCAPAYPAQRPASPTLHRLDAKFFPRTASSPPEL